MLIRASPHNSVPEFSFHNAMLSSVWPGVVSTVHPAPLGNHHRSTVSGITITAQPAQRGTWRTK